MQAPRSNIDVLPIDISKVNITHFSERRVNRQ
jgi:hypothetical protein